jgi:hypothetical protein
VLAWDRDGERVLSFPLSVDGDPAEPVVGSRRDAVVAFAPGGPPAVTDDPSAEDVAADGSWTVAIRRDGYRSTVTARSGEGPEVAVWDAVATAAAPCVLAVEDGAWVAFHHNRREDTGEPDLAKWIAVRFVDGRGRVFEPSAEVVDRDRDREGEEQSFEFPSLAIGPRGALAVFGRGSHRFWRQDLDHTGFSRRVALGDEGWGCRGRRVAVVSVADRLLTARRERAGIVIEPAAVPEGRRAELVPCPTRLRRVGPPPRPADRDDPAARWSRRTLFGDIHQHSAHSDGLGTADEPYLRARHLYGDDFCALTDHESFLGKRIGPGEWRYLVAVADRHDEPGRFTTLIAYEWTGRMHPGPGHKVVYLPSSAGAVISRDDVPDGGELVARAMAAGGFAVPHHVGWTGADEGAHDPDGQPVWEICSCHGCYESFAHALGQRGDLRDQMVDAVLRRGHRFGFIACSDGHGLLHHHGIARKRDPFRTGLTAVQATANTREAILCALRDRRCYATSGARILLDLRVGDRPMGSFVPTAGPARVDVVVRGTAAVSRLELVGRDGVIDVATPDREHATLSAEVDDAYVYARVTQRDGEMAWSSPVFFGPPRGA